MQNSNKSEILQPLTAASFDYALDESRIAQEPLTQRDLSKLMVLTRGENEICDAVFRDIPSLLRPGDLLVLNQTSVVPARFFARRASGGRIEGLFLSEDSPGQWTALLRNAQKCRAGERLDLDGSDGVRLVISQLLGQGEFRLAVDPPLPAAQVLGQAGLTPLPPYIRRAAQRDSDRADRSRYQTVYASAPGAVAAPTAGLHFTPALLEQLSARGIETARLTLHVGMGTFLPVKCEDPREHKMHSEWYDLPAQAAASINRARRDGRRVVAVGTTSVRVLETLARDAEPPSPPQAAAPQQAGPARADLFAPCQGWTDIFIYPPYRFRAVDALITNFHLPRSTLLMLTAAFCSPGQADGVGIILGAYREAIRRQYRFYSYGDAMLIQ
jgi:S-adenosylmethionine:tRNA ribosyltransferase-isomerase